MKRLAENLHCLPLAPRTHGGEPLPTGGWRGGEEIPEGGWRLLVHEAIPPGAWKVSPLRDQNYRTRDGLGHFTFAFYPTGEAVEIDILDMPSYRNRSEDLHDTHRIPSERGGFRICFGNPSIVCDEQTARKWARQWAELTWRYIRTGLPFPNG